MSKPQIEVEVISTRQRTHVVQLCYIYDGQVYYATCRVRLPRWGGSKGTFANLDGLMREWCESQGYQYEQAEIVSYSSTDEIHPPRIPDPAPDPAVEPASEPAVAPPTSQRRRRRGILST